MAHAASGPAADSAAFACVAHLDDGVAGLPHRCRRPCPASHLPTRDGWRVINAAIASARRWGAIGAYRLEIRILRWARILHRQRRMSHNSLRTVLSATRLLQRFGAFLALGDRRKRKAGEKDFHHDRID